MSELPPQPGTPDESHHHAHPAEETTLPAWVPVAIGGVLVLMAGLAVFTGLRYRNNTITTVSRPRHKVQAPANVAPPGEPEAGASLIFPGTAGEAPSAHPPVSGASRAIVTGTGGTIDATVRIWARRGMQLNVVPDDAIVYVNDVAVGEAKQFNTADEIYDFPAAGSYNVKLVAPGYKERAFVVTATDTAKNEIARVEARLDKE